MYGDIAKADDIKIKLTGSDFNFLRKQFREIARNIALRTIPRRP